MKQKVVLTCPPVEPHDQEALGLRSVTPGQDYKKARCSRCGREVWIGPKQQQLCKREHNPIWCFNCARKNPAPAVNLGGVGAAYVKDEGLIISAGNRSN